MIPMANHPRSRKAALTDLLLAYLAIVVLAVLAYFYFASSFSSQIFKVHISHESYRNSFVQRDMNLIGHLNRWGDDESMTYRRRMGEIAIGSPIFRTNRELTQEEIDRLPVESYLGEVDRPAVCDGCFEYNIQLVIENNVCSNGQGIDLLILIFSSPENVDKRKAIRETWLSPYVNNTGRVRHLFLLGLSEFFENDARIQKENMVHRDILEGDFIEDYQNLTYKTLMGLKWGVERCHMAYLIAKVDDDVWLNIETTLDLTRFRPLPFAVGGKCLYGAKPVRNPDAKWYASFQSFPETHYPPFCVGPGYITTVDTATKIIAMSKNVPYFHLEDVYVGMCLQQLNLRVKNVFGFLTVQPVGHICRNRHQTIVLVHGIPPAVMRALWGSICRPKNRRTHPVLGFHTRRRMW